MEASGTLSSKWKVLELTPVFNAPCRLPAASVAEESARYCTPVSKGGSPAFQDQVPEDTPTKGRGFQNGSFCEVQPPPFHQVVKKGPELKATLTPVAPMPELAGPADGN